MILSAVYFQAYIFYAIDVIIFSSRFSSLQIRNSKLVKILTSAASILTFKKRSSMINSAKEKLSVSGASSSLYLPSLFGL